MANEPPRDGNGSSFSDEEKAELLKQYQEEKTEQKEANADAVPEYGDVEALSQETKEEAIAIARDILDKLKIVYESIDLFELITMAEDDLLDDFAQDVNDLKSLFEFQVDQALMLDPTLSHDPEVTLAGDAIGMMSAVSRAYAKKKSKEINEEMLAFTAQQEILQAQQQNPKLQGKTVDKLAEDVERGLNKIQQKTRDAQRNMTPEDLDLRLERGLESRGVSPEQSQQQNQQQQQQQQAQQQQQTAQARQTAQALRAGQQQQMGGQQIGGQQQQQQARRAAAAVQDVVRRRQQQQMRNPQLAGQQANQQNQQQQARRQQQAQQQRFQAWQQQQQQIRRQMQRRQQLAQNLDRIKAAQKAASAVYQARAQNTQRRIDQHHEDHHDHHHDDHHHEPASIQKPGTFSAKPGMPGMKGDLSKMLAGADFSALKNNLSAVDSEKSVVGPRNAKDTVREIQAKQMGQNPDDLPPIPPKKGPLVGM